jgi:hypothetical protein
MTALPANAPIAVLMPVGDVHIGERHRREMGVIAGLAASIAELGLLHPIVVTPDGKLSPARGGWKP